MKMTDFEKAIALGVASFITFLERTLDTGATDSNVSTEIFIPAVELRNEIRNSLEKYSERMLKLRAVKN